MSFYAVAKGKNIGIFDSWNECKNNTDSFKGAIFKKFNSKEDAEKFILDNTATEISNKPTIEYNNIKLEGTNAFDILMKPKLNKKIIEIEDSLFKPDYYVYTDGSCSNNGKADAKAGIGIYFGENDSRNVSRLVIGKQSNNTAELGAILHLYDIIENDLLIGKKIGVVSDSEYAIRCATTYGKKCDEEGWKKDIPNKDIVKKIFELYNGKLNIKFLHIMAHTGKEDIHSIGNDGADKLANNAIGLEECPYKVKNTRIYLVVPIIKKDVVKGLGGRWDVSKKLWYIFGDSSNKEKVLSLFKTTN